MFTRWLVGTQTNSQNCSLLPPALQQTDGQGAAWSAGKSLLVMGGPGGVEEPKGERGEVWGPGNAKPYNL